MRRQLLTAFLLGVSLLPQSSFATHGNVVPGDYDGDGRTDIVVARKLGGAWVWFVNFANGTQSEHMFFGLAPETDPDVLLAGDFDGDGKFEPGVVRAISGYLNWFSRNADGSAVQVIWGLNGDTPLTGFFGGQGESDRAVVRNSSGYLTWYIQNQAEQGIGWGLEGDRPFAADINGDGVDELIVARTEGNAVNWYVRNLTGNLSTVTSWGLAGDTLLPPSDFNGDGKADLAVARNYGDFRVIFIKYTELGDLFHSVLFGLKEDLTYIGFFTQSTAAELASLRETPGGVSTHFVRFALQDFVAQVPFGLAGDSLVQPQGGAAVNEPDPTPRACEPSPGTADDFLDGAGGGALWKPVSEGVANAAPVVLLPIGYCGASLSVLSADGNVVSGVQRRHCGGNGNRAHFWLALRASQLAAYAPLTVKVVKSGVTECRSVPNPGQRYD